MTLEASGELLVVDVKLGNVLRGDRVVATLSPQQTRILCVLVRRPYMMFSYERLFVELYGDNPDDEPEHGAENCLRVVMCFIRKKLRKAGFGDLIRCAYRRGYYIMGKPETVRLVVGGSNVIAVDAVLRGLGPATD